MEDMTTLLNLSEPSVLRNLSFRFGDNGIQYQRVSLFIVGHPCVLLVLHTPLFSCCTLFPEPRSPV